MKSKEFWLGVTFLAIAGFCIIGDITAGVGTFTLAGMLMIWENAKLHSQ